MSHKTWFITGANSGFGREITEQLLSRGDRVAGTVRRLAEMQELKGQYGDQLWLASLDLVETATIKDVVDSAFRDLGRIDTVINNAGYALFGAAEELTDEQIAHQVSTNFTGAVHVARAAIPHLRHQGGGRIIAVSSYAGQCGFAGASLYCATKWGLEGFFDSIGEELRPFGIGVTIVEPGGAPTSFRAGAKLGPASDIYAGTPASAIRSRIDASSPPPRGDLVRMARRVIDSVVEEPAPRRLVLGSDAYAAIKKALARRLAAVEAQSLSACSTDLPRYNGSAENG